MKIRYAGNWNGESAGDFGKTSNCSPANGFISATAMETVSLNQISSSFPPISPSSLTRNFPTPSSPARSSNISTARSFNSFGSGR